MLIFIIMISTLLINHFYINHVVFFSLNWVKEVNIFQY